MAWIGSLISKIFAWWYSRISKRNSATKTGTASATPPPTSEKSTPNSEGSGDGHDQR